MPRWTGVIERNSRASGDKAESVQRISVKTPKYWRSLKIFLGLKNRRENSSL
jgi:hypothetical protein